MITVQELLPTLKYDQFVTLNFYLKTDSGEKEFNQIKGNPSCLVNSISYKVSSLPVTTVYSTKENHVTILAEEKKNDGK